MWPQAIAKDCKFAGAGRNLNCCKIKLSSATKQYKRKKSKMKLEPNVNGSPVVTPLKISAALGGQAKVEPAITDTPKTDNEDDYDQYPDADEDLDDGGGSCAKNENGSEFSVESKSFGKAEPIDNETGETEESSSATGKKKSVRKKRSLNWEEGERVSSPASICVFYV